MVARWMKSRRFLSSVVIALGMSSLVREAPRAVTGQKSEDVTVSGSRPLEAAVRVFGTQCGCMVTYEDVKWTSDQVEESPVLRRRSDGVPGLVPRGVPFTFTVPRDLGARKPAEVARSLQELIGQFENGLNPGRFKAVRGETGLHVMPLSGGLLERHVTVATEDIPALTAIRTVLEAVGRAAGEHADLARVPANLLKHSVRVSARNEPAYEVISNILGTSRKGLSWKLQYEVNARIYFMTVYVR